MKALKTAKDEFFYRMDSVPDAQQQSRFSKVVPVVEDWRHLCQRVAEICLSGA